jgi:glycosyltransferase involved in cell wall biosynthesis
LSLFATEVLPSCPNATLTLVGDGPDHDDFRAHAERLGITENTCFPGEIPVAKMVNWYAHGDVFAYSSLSETYGQVVSEALWCGLPVVAFDDKMGVAGQVSSGQDGFLVEPGPDEEAGNAEFGARVLELLHDPEQRRTMGEQAGRLARLRSDPNQCISRLYAALESARLHCSKARPWESATRWQKFAPKFRMAALHGLVLTLGLLRKPATLNRNGARPIGWDSL